MIPECCSFCGQEIFENDYQESGVAGPICEDCCDINDMEFDDE